MKHGGGLGRVFYKPETGPGKSYKVFWASGFDTNSHKWFHWRVKCTPATRLVVKKLQKKKSRFWAKEMIARELIEPDNGRHDETTCCACYEEFYGRPPANPEDFKYGHARYRIVPNPVLSNEDDPSPEAYVRWLKEEVTYEGEKMTRNEAYDRAKKFTPGPADSPSP